MLAENAANESEKQDRAVGPGHVLSSCARLLLIVLEVGVRLDPPGVS